MKLDANKKQFIPYIMAGANGLDRLESELRLLEKHGATAIELGIPFSDPVADGPVIEQAGISARKKGVTLQKVLNFLQQHTFCVPIILMGYANSFVHYGSSALAKALEHTQVQGLIIPDLPYEHRELITADLPDSITLITMVSLTSSPERIQLLTQEATGFIYAVTLNGVTGKQQAHTELAPYFQAIKQTTAIPVCAGFGIHTAQDVAYFLSICDGIVIGSAIVQKLATASLEEVDSFLTELLAPLHHPVY
ncbi:MULTISPECIES: tryptophan synthase subunit alpha [Enterococcus]|uniref:Tryptophan synthase alpha chain n=1 Tax=Enterococcus sulfureus ATCC 49903 TaxID=1140003 RepID=S0PFJ5_9ENTE|nr:tryptophan synthase subunit alpha [Enterococcus sulfureus]EOT49551.1 tryptophan synthase, alpha subunit [Enterococcus sulfureus ATCC 49903]EOT87418.1 tryptophan synthase, alpha subunit [Enterococcus sulfureus ATCC 49903]